MWKLFCLQAKCVQTNILLKNPFLYTTFFCWTCCGTVVPVWCASSSCCRTQQCLSSNHSIPDRARDQVHQSMRRRRRLVVLHVLSDFRNICGLVCCSNKESKSQRYRCVDEVLYMVWSMPADNQSWFLEANTTMLLVLRLLLLVMTTNQI